MSGLVEFPGLRPDRDWSMIFCEWCRSTAMRLVARGASQTYEVRCHNCGNLFDDLSVTQDTEAHCHED